MDLLKSVSRTLPGALLPAQNALRLSARDIMSIYGDMEEMIRLGAYKEGSNAKVDTAARVSPKVEALLSQEKHDRGDADAAFTELAALLEAKATE